MEPCSIIGNICVRISSLFLTIFGIVFVAKLFQGLAPEMETPISSKVYFFYAQKAETFYYFFTGILGYYLMKMIRDKPFSSRIYSKYGKLYELSLMVCFCLIQSYLVNTGWAWLSFASKSCFPSNCSTFFNVQNEKNCSNKFQFLAQLRDFTEQTCDKNHEDKLENELIEGLNCGLNDTTSGGWGCHGFFYNLPLVTLSILPGILWSLLFILRNTKSKIGAVKKVVEMSEEEKELDQKYQDFMKKFKFDFEAPVKLVPAESEPYTED